MPYKFDPNTYRMVGLRQRWRDYLPWLPLLLPGLLLLLLLMGCTDTTGPSEPSYTPQFQKVYNSGDGGGGGHGGGGSASQCTRPDASVECMLKYLGLGVGGGMLAGCSLASLGACLAGGGPAWAYGAYDYNNTPDCRSCGHERGGVGTGRGIGPTDPWNLPPGSPPDGD